MEDKEEAAYHRFQRPHILDGREVAVASRLDVSNSPIELANEDELATRIVAALNARSDFEIKPPSRVKCADKGEGAIAPLIRPQQ